jgi:hypothetical protein
MSLYSSCVIGEFAKTAWMVAKHSGGTGASAAADTAGGGGAAAKAPGAGVDSCVGAGTGADEGVVAGAGTNGSEAGAGADVAGSITIGTIPG